jgi:hypothetical protein
MHMGELNNGENFNVKMKMNDVSIDISPLWKGWNVPQWKSD